jgi:hypothetical protein
LFEESIEDFDAPIMTRFREWLSPDTPLC